MARRRRRVRYTGATMGALLADLDRDRKQREYDEAKAKADAREKSNERAKRYARIVTNYVKDGTMTYEEANTALKAELGTETDPELKGILQDYISDIKLTKQSKDINNLVDDYTYGRRSYQSFKSAMEGTDKSNALVAEAVAKNLQQARKTENARQLTKWGADYKSGALPYEQYVKNLNELRSESDQKDPNDIAAITQHLTAAQQNEQQIQDNKVYVQWQSDGNAGAALQYFNSRLAQSKNIQDANTIEQYIKTINATQSQRGSAAAAASSKVLDQIAEQAMKAYEDKTLKKDLEAAKGDPQAVLAAYERFAQFIGGPNGILSLGAPKGVEYRLRLETLGVEAQAAASDAILNQTMSDIEKWTKVAEDKNSDPQAVANAWKKVASLAAKTETSPWLIAGHEKVLAAREMAANKLAEFAREQQAKREQGEMMVKAEVGRLYDGAMNVAQFDKNGKPIIPAARNLKTVMDAGVKFDGTADDKNRFAEWLMKNPEAASALERAAGVNVSTVVKTVPGGGVTDTSTTFGDMGEGPPKTGSLFDLITATKSAQTAADKAFAAAMDAFFPGASSGKYNITDNLEEEGRLIRASQKPPKPPTPAMDTVRPRDDYDKFVSSGAAAAQGLDPTLPANQRGPVTPGGVLGALGQAGQMVFGGMFGGAASANTPPLPTVEYSEVAQYLLARLRHDRSYLPPMPTPPVPTYETPQMAPPRSPGVEDHLPVADVEVPAPYEAPPEPAYGKRDQPF